MFKYLDIVGCMGQPTAHIVVTPTSIQSNVQFQVERNTSPYGDEAHITMTCVPGWQAFAKKVMGMSTQRYTFPYSHWKVVETDGGDIYLYLRENPEIQQDLFLTLRTKGDTSITVDEHSPLIGLYADASNSSKCRIASTQHASIDKKDDAFVSIKETPKSQ